MKKILVAVDFSKTTPPVLDMGLRVARAFQAEVWLLHVGPPDPDFVGMVAGPQSVRDSRADEMRENQRKLESEARRFNASGVTTTPLMVQGAMVEKILEKAQDLDVDLIVLGSHGHGALYKALLGSVSEGVLRKAGRPVLIVPARKE